MKTIQLPSRITSADDIRPALDFLVAEGGSDLFILGGSPLWVSQFGKKVALTSRKISEKEVEAVLQDIYGINAPARIGAGETIDTFYEFRQEKSRFRFRLNAVGCLRGGRATMTITLRSIPTTPPSAADLGIEREILDVCQKSDQGLILVVGATGNGKSTLLASILRDQLEAPDGHRNLVTIESPIEFVYDDVECPTSFFTQMEVGRHIQSFSHGVINSLRMAPTTILVGESRDYETISASIEASVTGHVVYSTVHANSVAETLQRMVSVYPEDLQQQARQDLMQAIKLVVAQRLMPSEDGKRIALREWLAPTGDDIKRKLAESPNLARATQEAVLCHGHPMIKSAEQALADGKISRATRDRIAANYGE